MISAGIPICTTIGYTQTVIGGTATSILSLVGVEKIQTWLFGAKGGDYYATSSETIGGNGGFLSATLNVSAYQSLIVVMGPAPDLRRNSTDLSTRLVVAGAG